MTHEDLTPGVVLKWLRLQAKKYTDTAQRYTETAHKFSQAADVLESTAEPSMKSGVSQATHGIPAPHTRIFSTSAVNSS